MANQNTRPGGGAPAGGFAFQRHTQMPPGADPQLFQASSGLGLPRALRIAILNACMFRLTQWFQAVDYDRSGECLS